MEFNRNTRAIKIKTYEEKKDIRNKKKKKKQNGGIEQGERGKQIAKPAPPVETMGKIQPELNRLRTDREYNNKNERKIHRK